MPPQKSTRKLEHFMLGETLGVGGYSKVKLGINEKTGERVALKILFKKGKTEMERKQLLAELHAMAKIKHKNVISLKYFEPFAKYPNKDGTTKDCTLIVLELATGGELFDFLMYAGKFNEKVARTYFSQLLDGLEACHSQGIAHRDLKPENILLNGDFLLKIADFGFSHVFKNDSGKYQYMRTECGTRGYMAPEILSGKKYTHKTDLFAAGIILFIMLAGFPPFQNANQTDWWFHKLMVKKYHLFWMAHERTAKFSDDAKDLIQRILEPKVEDRYDIKDIRNHKWMKGKTLTTDDLKQELAMKKQKVDVEKAKERKNDKKDVDVEQTGLVSRALNDPNSEQLPECMPQLAGLFNKEKNEKLDITELATAVDGEIEEFDPSVHVSTFTQFETGNHPMDVMLAVREVVEDKLHGKIQMNPTNCFSVIKLNVDNSPVQLSVKFYKLPSQDTSKDQTDAKDAPKQAFLVVFKRLMGDPMKFSNTFNKEFMKNEKILPLISE